MSVLHSSFSLHRRYQPFGPALIAVLLTPASVQADAGIPTVFVSIPCMLLALVPVSVLEALVLQRIIGGAIKKTLGAVVIANLWSTLLGLPIATLLQLSVGIPASALGPLLFRGKPADSLSTVLFMGVFLGLAGPGRAPALWAIPAAMALMTFFYLLVSWLIEYRVITRRLGLNWGWQFSRAVLLANLASYGVLFAVWLGIWCYS